MPTLKQERLAEALLDPSITTKTAAMLKAGYSPVTADRKPGRMVGAVGVQRARSEILDGRSDSAHSLNRRVKLKIVERVEEGASDQLLVGVLKVTEDAIASAPPEDETRFLPPGYLRDRRRRKAMRHRLVALRYFLAMLDSGQVEELRAMGQPGYVPPNELP